MRVWSVNLLEGAWAIWLEMAPYLLIGFLVAGMLSVWLSAVWVRRHLGGGGWRAALRAALVGVPLPLCSCSVIPVAASLRNQGASRGATAAFLMSTPQVGANSLVVTYGLLGPVMACARAAVAFVSGLLCGTIVDGMEHERKGKAPEATAAAACRGGNPSPAAQAPAWKRVLRHALVTLPRDITAPLLIGITISALLGALLPEGFFADRLSPGLSAMLLMLVVGIPMYVCSTSSIPVALTLIHAGVPEGAALVFLVTGPATNAATLTVLLRLLGGRATLVYLGVLVVCALLAGWALDRWLLVRQPDLVPFHLPHGPAPLWKQLSGIALLVLLLTPIVRSFVNRFRSDVSREGTRVPASQTMERSESSCCVRGNSGTSLSIRGGVRRPHPVS